tara:strand:- start:1682 stop:1837 length:156 start_codon:yes stop_codon:yes gene_type:complete
MIRGKTVDRKAKQVSNLKEYKMGKLKLHYNQHTNKMKEVFDRDVYFDASTF